MVVLKSLPAVALMIVSGVIAAPWDRTSRHTTHRIRSVGPAKVKIPSYHPPVTFETFGVEGIDHPLAKRGFRDTSPSDAAKSFLESKLGVEPDELSRKGGHASDVGSFEYFQRIVNGIPVANAVANVALRNGKVTSFGASFVDPRSVSPAEPKLSKEEAIFKAEEVTGAKYNEWPATLEYFAKDSDHVVLTYVVQVQNSDTAEWYEAYVDAHTGETVNVVDFVSDASVDPADITASPYGWHTTGTGSTITPTTSTTGNNIVSFKSITTGISVQSSATNNYDYPYNSAVGPDVSPNADAARVNAFYAGNAIHDLTYLYGFNEASYNFQTNNYGRGGAANDRVRISVQVAGGLNNANFDTPPDGQSGQMRMYIWNYTAPNRDGALENDIIVHEYGHGVSNRLTGGGTARCLQTVEASGLGEGWSDALAELTEVNSATPVDFTLGSFVTGMPGGIRTYPYSTSKTTNPLTYESLATLTEVHDIGEVWALIWHEITASLLTKYGFSDNPSDPTGTAGNIVALHLFIDAFKIQPCNPTFLTARDAIIQADANRYGGANKCLLWAAFAKRGLGTGATSTKVNNTALPSGC